MKLHEELDRASDDYESRPGFRWSETWNEEWLVVVTGEPTLRSPSGEQRLRPGDVVCFPAGPDGAHQVRNDADEPTRVLMLSTLRSPDVVRYVDSDKLGTRPGAREDSLNFVRPAAVGYWEGEA